MANLLAQFESSELVDFMNFIGLLIHKLQSELFNVLDELIGPLSAHITHLLNQPVTDTDDSVEHAETKRTYLTLLTNVMSSDLHDIFISDFAVFRSGADQLQRLTAKSKVYPALSDSSTSVLFPQPLWCFHHLSLIDAMPIDKINKLSREDVKSRLTFAGFLVFHRPLKLDAVETLKMLTGSSHRCIMITGDHPLTVVHGDTEVVEALTLDLRENPIYLSGARLSPPRHASEGYQLEGPANPPEQNAISIRVSLVGAETSEVHLQERINQLTRQLRGNEEKLAMYERRTSAANGATPATEQDLPREQQLEQEVAELWSAVKVAQVNLTAARSHMQQFQEISQANEAALSALNATHDQYKAETEAQISQNEVESTPLCVEDDVRQSADKFSEFQHAFESAWLSEVRQQEERALAAEARYSLEVILLAESIKTIEALKQPLSVAQTTSRKNLSVAANALAKLAASEGSWRPPKEVLDQEIADLNARSRDLSAQNALLHQHLETVSAQATRMCQAADSSATDGTSGDADIGGDVDTQVSELRSVVAYWRKEKEMVDLQLELSKQEKQTRETLAETLERAMEAVTLDAQHAEMLERINQFNILRESNATLRVGCEAYAKRSHELDAKLQALSAELKPVKDQARELGARDAQITRLEGESRCWQERNAQLLSKKAEVEKLATESVKNEPALSRPGYIFFSNANAVLTSLKLSRLEANFRTHEDSNTKNAKNFKSSLGLLNREKSQLNATINELEGKIKILTAERDALRTTSASDASQQLNSQVETLRREKIALEQALANERAVKAQASAEGPSDHPTLIVSLRED
ncbi:uncharacterized protein HD556DRAFT_1441766 [Suillus plorans]|uniref:Uncharacterized protein n=1 Tax=Suillus plorans TaxID=116603 RepID=A0A9P7DJ66_9AGAM|nr:uncharacterized protein HD556DRAFT_1441766 [Suillus plorans]KAG1795936.1 hypothetical protein HD556DRAFT_1441766 [Suillus plorans]